MSIENNDGWNTKPDGWENMLHLYNNNVNNINITKFLEYKSKIDNYKDIDGIFVLAGGIDTNGLCHSFVIDRLNEALCIHKITNKPIFCIGGGSYHTKPILNNSNFIIHESTSCAEYLISIGVNPSLIYKEYASFDTIANGYYSFTNFILPLNFKKIILITSEFHMKRSKMIFEWMKYIFNYKIDIEYISTSNNKLDGEILKLRKERETNSFNNLINNLIIKYQNIEEFHKWFYTQHKAYSSNSELIRTDDIDNKILKKSY